jgi:hypothetical protein
MNFTADTPREWLIDAAAAAVLGCAIALACAKLAMGPQPLVAGLGGFALALAALRCVPAGDRKLVVPDFDAIPLAFTDAAEQAPPVEDALVVEDALLLEDVLAPPAADARVVQLFDTARMAAAGELVAGHDRQSGRAPAHPELHDASQALTDALRELRRALG